MVQKTCRLDKISNITVQCDFKGNPSGSFKNNLIGFFIEFRLRKNTFPELFLQNIHQYYMDDRKL